MRAELRIERLRRLDAQRFALAVAELSGDVLQLEVAEGRAILKIESNRCWNNIETYEPAVDDAFASAWSAVLALHRAIP